jgi:D-glycero-D-manno-heptose 1,7-bisphosphate phosphatase
MSGGAAVPRPGVYLSGKVVEDSSLKRRKALFLDRDGVINVNHGYVHRPDQTEWVPGVFDFCRQAQEAGFLCVVVTNQAGIARGYYSESTFLDYTRWMHEQFASRGVPLLATFYCPHHPTAGVGQWMVDCECRKPQPGMILAAKELFNLSLPDSILVGDQPSDLEAASAAGVGRAVMIDANSASPFGNAYALLSPSAKPQGP